MSIGRQLPVASIGLILLGASSAFYVNFVGQLYVGEIIILLALPMIALGQRRYHTYPQAPQLFRLSCLTWLIGILISAALHRSELSASVQLLAGAVFTIIDVIGISAFTVGVDDVFLILVGTSVGQVFAVFLQPSMYSETNAWKFGAGTAVTALVLFTFQRHFVLRFFLLAFGLLSVVLDTRYLALISLATFALMVATDGLRTRVRLVGLLGTFVTLTALVGVIVSQVYSYAVRTGVLGASAETKFEAQGKGSPFLVLLGGRNEIFFSLRGAASSPITGLGSSPTLTYDIATAGTNQMLGLGIQSAVTQANQPGDPLPVHSYLMGGWIYGGALGLIAWLLITGIVVRGTLRYVQGNNPRRYLVAFLGVLTMWNILFSPYGATERFQLALLVVVLSRQTNRPATE